MSTGSPAHSLLTRPLSAHPVCPRLHSAISNGSLFAGYKKFEFFHWLTILVPSATRLRMSLTSSPGRTKKFEFFHWLTRSRCAAEMKITKLYASHFTSGPDGGCRATKMATIPDRSEGIVKFPRNQSSTSPATMSFSTVIIVFCCSSRQGEKKRQSDRCVS